MFMALTGGMDWEEVYDLATLAGPVGAGVCILFVLIFTMAVWNIIGSIYVEKVMAMAQPTDHELMEKEMLQRRVDAAEIEEFFVQFGGKDHADSVTEKEFDRIVEDGSLAAFMAVRDLDLEDDNDIKELFQLTQELQGVRTARDHPGQPRRVAKKVTIDALVATCLKVKGGAKRFELALLRSEVHKTRHMLNDSIQGVVSQLSGEIRKAVEDLFRLQEPKPLPPLSASLIDCAVQVPEIDNLAAIHRGNLQEFYQFAV